jgi:NADH-quinone oxidoreductase subunit F
MTMRKTEAKVLTSGDAVTSLGQYREAGGLRAYEQVRDADPHETIAVIRDAGLRGRGGAGFPTAMKWQGIHDSPADRRFAVCNGAEGEPGTFKDRFLLRHNPYQTLEGLAIAAQVTGAERAYFCIKSGFVREAEQAERAIEEFRDAGVAVEIELVRGPDEYLFGEEKAMLEVIEGGLPMPRVFPPYVEGLFGGKYGGPSDRQNNPTLVNNVETLAHVPHILREGFERFREHGTDDTPGTMVFTVTGDVQRPVVVELPLGLTVRDLVETVAGGAPEGRTVKAVLPGAASGVITEEMLEAVLGFDSMKKAGSALGSAGFIAYDDTACMVKVAEIVSRFLYVESCNQCPPCKMGSRQITDQLERLLRYEARFTDVEKMMDTTTWVANSSRCYLPTSESLVISSIIAAFADEFADHTHGSCERRHDLPLPKLTDYSAAEGFTYDLEWSRKQPDWSYATG